MAEHYPWCQAAQNNAMPRSMRLIGPECNCDEYRRKLREWKEWCESDDGADAILGAIKNFPYDAKP